MMEVIVGVGLTALIGTLGAIFTQLVKIHGDLSSVTTLVKQHDAEIKDNREDIDALKLKVAMNGAY